MKNKDHPQTLLAKNSYSFVALRMKPKYLNTIGACCCYTAENAYYLHKWLPNDTKFDKSNGELGKKIMKLKESSPWTQRFFVPACWRGYTGFCIAECDKEIVFSLDKPTKLPICCCKRPEITVNYLDHNENSKKLNDTEVDPLTKKEIIKDLEEEDCELVNFHKIGRAVIPFSLMSFECTIYNQDNIPTFRIYATRFQCQNCLFPLPFGACKEFTFNICLYYDPDFKPIGHIYKKWSDCYS